MMYNYRSARFTALSEAEKTQFKEKGFIGGENGDGYPAMPVAAYDMEYTLPSHEGPYAESLSVNMAECPVGCIYDGKRFDGVEGGSTSSVFYAVEPTVCSATRHSNIRFFDDFVEAIRYYDEIRGFGDSLKKGNI